MAQRTHIVLVDDLTGDVLPDGQGQTVSFSLDGTQFEIDLKNDNAEKFRDDLKRYVAAARRVGRQPADRRRTAGIPADKHAIRAWAKGNGYEVSDRGRIPAAVVAAYEAAN